MSYRHYNNNKEKKWTMNTLKQTGIEGPFLPVSVPATFVFDPTSVLKSHLPSHVEINATTFPPNTTFIHPPDDVSTPFISKKKIRKRKLTVYDFFLIKVWVIDRENAFTLPRHLQRNSSVGDSAALGRQDIMRKGRIGFLTAQHVLGRWEIYHWREQHYRLMVLGVHWDTTAFIDSFNDNDSGVAAIIEVAKALIE